MSGPSEDTSATYAGQLEQRVAELLPDLTTPERLELLDAMDPDDLRTSLAWLVSFAPQTFDFALVRDRELVERLQERLDHQHDDDPEPYCTTCGACVGIFIGHGDAWLHYTGEGTVASPIELYDAGHAPVIAWREALPPAGTVLLAELRDRMGIGEPIDRPGDQRLPACLVCGVRPVAAPDVVVCADCDQTGADR